MIIFRPQNYDLKLSNETKRSYSGYYVHCLYNHDSRRTTPSISKPSGEPCWTQQFEFTQTKEDSFVINLVSNDTQEMVATVELSLSDDIKTFFSNLVMMVCKDGSCKIRIEMEVITNVTKQLKQEDFSFQAVDQTHVGKVTSTTITEVKKTQVEDYFSPKKEGVSSVEVATQKFVKFSKDELKIKIQDQESELKKKREELEEYRKKFSQKQIEKLQKKIKKAQRTLEDLQNDRDNGPIRDLEREKKQELLYIEQQIQTKLKALEIEKLNRDRQQKDIHERDSLWQTKEASHHQTLSTLEYQKTEQRRKIEETNHKMREIQQTLSSLKQQKKQKKAMLLSQESSLVNLSSADGNVQALEFTITNLQDDIKQSKKLILEKEQKIFDIQGQKNKQQTLGYLGNKKNELEQKLAQAKVEFESEDYNNQQLRLVWKEGLSVKTQLEEKRVQLRGMIEKNEYKKKELEKITLEKDRMSAKITESLKIQQEKEEQDRYAKEQVIQLEKQLEQLRMEVEIIRKSLLAEKHVHIKDIEKRERMHEFDMVQQVQMSKTMNSESHQLLEASRHMIVNKLGISFDSKEYEKFIPNSVVLGLKDRLKKSCKRTKQIKRLLGKFIKSGEVKYEKTASSASSSDSEDNEQQTKVKQIELEMKDKRKKHKENITQSMQIKSNTVQTSVRYEHDFKEHDSPINPHKLAQSVAYGVSAQTTKIEHMVTPYDDYKPSKRVSAHKRPDDKVGVASTDMQREIAAIQQMAFLQAQQEYQLSQEKLKQQSLQMASQLVGENQKTDLTTQQKASSTTTTISSQSSSSIQQQSSTSSQQQIQQTQQQQYQKGPMYQSITTMKSGGGDSTLFRSFTQTVKKRDNPIIISMGAVDPAFKFMQDTLHIYIDFAEKHNDNTLATKDKVLLHITEDYILYYKNVPATFNKFNFNPFELKPYRGVKISDITSWDSNVNQENAEKKYLNISFPKNKMIDFQGLKKDPEYKIKSEDSHRWYFERVQQKVNPVIDFAEVLMQGYYQVHHVKKDSIKKTT